MKGPPEFFRIRNITKWNLKRKILSAQTKPLAKHARRTAAFRATLQTVFITTATAPARPTR